MFPLTIVTIVPSGASGAVVPVQAVWWWLGGQLETVGEWRTRRSSSGLVSTQTPAPAPSLHQPSTQELLPCQCRPHLLITSTSERCMDFFYQILGAYLFYVDIHIKLIL